ncbi:MAG: radical SAM protein [Chthonomonadales bacterium]
MRGPKNRLDPSKPYGFFQEQELGPDGFLETVNVILLTNRECPFRCIFCDLWRNTADQRVAPGAIPGQIRYALERLPPATAIKLYNSGSFFDPNAVPPEDDAAICGMLNGMRRVIVESHPSFVGPRCFRFAERLEGHLEVAMGLETANARVLARLRKGMTLESFAGAAATLISHGISLRTFVLVGPPYQSKAEGVEWSVRSLEFAFDCGAEVATLIPARGSTPELEALRQTGDFAEPSLAELEAAAEQGVRLGRGRVFADLWDVDRLDECACSPARVERLSVMNRTQQVPPPVACAQCGGV